MRVFYNTAYNNDWALGAPVEKTFKEFIFIAEHLTLTSIAFISEQCFAQLKLKDGRKFNKNEKEEYDETKQHYFLSLAEHLFDSFQHIACNLNDAFERCSAEINKLPEKVSVKHVSQ